MSRQPLRVGSLEVLQKRGFMQKGEFGCVVLSEDVVQLVPNGLGELQMQVIDVAICRGRPFESATRWFSTLPGFG